MVFDHNYALHVMNADGSGVRFLTGCAGSECFGKTQPAWSPDGHTIAFVWDDDPHFEIRTIESDGTGERMILDCRRPCVAVQDPSWSPDGSMIAFTYVYISGDVRRHVYVMNADGSGVLPLPSGDIDTCCVDWLAGS
jgi:Tol biopolymer transport system component